jgi:hypothetical protein
MLRAEPIPCHCRGSPPNVPHSGKACLLSQAWPWARLCHLLVLGPGWASVTVISDVSWMGKWGKALAPGLQKAGLSLVWLRSPGQQALWVAQGTQCLYLGRLRGQWGAAMGKGRELNINCHASHLTHVTSACHLSSKQACEVHSVTLILYLRKTRPRWWPAWIQSPRHWDASKSLSKPWSYCHWVTHSSPAWSL